jgi:hypothetical protein
MNTKADDRLNKHSTCPAQAEHGRKSTREGDKNGLERRERMKRGRGMNVRDERSRGIEILLVDSFTMIKPTAPFKLAKHTGRRKRN